MTPCRARIVGPDSASHCAGVTSLPRRAGAARALVSPSGEPPCGLPPDPLAAGWRAPSHCAILLIGLRGSGKSSVASGVASALGRTWVDLDPITCSLLNCATVQEAWMVNGQQTFREAETRALRQTLSDENLVVALGGGTPTAPGAAGLIRQAQATACAAVVYLRARPETLRERLARTDLVTRPPVKGSDPLAEIEQLLAERGPLYESLADEIVDIGSQSVAHTVGAILTRLRHHFSID
ncbi:MAG: shikimate kinase [Phycisphaerales bacterium]